MHNPLTRLRASGDTKVKLVSIADQPCAGRVQLGKLEAEGPRRLLEREQRFGGRSGLRFRAEAGAAEGQSDSSADEDEGERLAEDCLLHAYPVLYPAGTWLWP